MYQLDALRLALAELESAVPGLSAWVDFTGSSMQTIGGRIPTVVGEVSGSRRYEMKESPITIAPKMMAEHIRYALEDLADDLRIAGLISNIESCSVER